MHGRDGTSGVDWSKATELGYVLLLSPLFGFILAALLLLALKVIVRNTALRTDVHYRASQVPRINEPAEDDLAHAPVRGLDREANGRRQSRGLRSSAARLPPRRTKPYAPSSGQLWRLACIPTR